MKNPLKGRSRGAVISLLQGVALGTCVGVSSGAAVAVFLVLLGYATGSRERHAGLSFGLPLAGLVLGWCYERYGRDVVRGNNLVIDTIADGGPGIPLRMAPMVVLATVVTHLFGGSAGREGTAVQVGASLADWFARRFGLRQELRRRLLVAGAAGGFGAVFGTPFAGALFGLEFVALGSFELGSLVPALVAALAGDQTVRALGVEHMPYPVVPPLTLDIGVGLRWLVFACAVAATVTVFVELLEFLKHRGQARIPRLSVRMFVGGLCVVLLWRVFGTSEFLGLGLPTISRAFTDPGLPWYTFAAKLLFTAVTLGAGFMGGEVTPLFLIGAALGNALAAPLGLPLAMCAGVGLAATFAAASNTRFALSLMAVELLGVHALPHVLLVCILASALTGARSIYTAQRGLLAKPRDPFLVSAYLRLLRGSRR